AFLAVALAATTRAASIATDGALESRQRLLATWTAEDRVAELRARRLFPSTGATQFRASQAGMEMVVDETVSDTPNVAIRRVDLAVADAPAPQRVAYRLREGTIERLAWAGVDAAPRDEPAAVAVLSGVASLTLRYLDAGGEWRSSYGLPGAAQTTLPAAVEVTLKLASGET